MADSSAAGPRHRVAVDVLIRLEHRDPPVGTVLLVRHEDERPGSEAAPAVRFTGWLGLLRVLSDVVGKPGK